MFNNLVQRGRQSARLLKSVGAAATTLKRRHDRAFAILHPQIEIVKASRTAQITVGVGITGLIVTGNFAAAVVVTGAWVGSRPLTHVVAGGLACVGSLDAALLKAVARLDRAAADADAATTPRASRRRNTQQPRDTAASSGA